MAKKPIHVTSEIGDLQRVVLHRPGVELANLKVDEFEKCWIHDAFYLEYAQKEHDVFADILRAEGAEVLYMEELLAEAMDQHPEARKAFLDEYMSQAPIPDPWLVPLVREKLDAITDNRELVAKALAGMRLKELDIAHGPRSLSRLDGDGLSPDDFVVYSMPSSYFSRDPIASIGTGVALHRMYWDQRNREVPFYKTFLTYHDDFAGTPFWYDNHDAAHIEGGDVLNINEKTLAIGISQRTEAAAIDTLARNLFWGPQPSAIETVYAIKIPWGYETMHLDTVCTQIDYDKFTVYPGMYDELKAYRLRKGDNEGEVAVEEIAGSLKEILEMATGVDDVQLIECGGGDPVEASREQWNDGSNTLAIAPGKVCVYERNVVTNGVLRQAGIELCVVPSEELSRGRGGPRCMSMPFARADI
ncbi:arginine deiminase [uncultured Adlercreutzia sp.]|uniref:arginine deiminase n=1 Tax=uncultured Adlercreutzia sp. TaxID=875803 RepID=UPI0026F3BCEE|nr:arginine deiminase [uncultured Adlercreutzia sp.]